MIPLISALGLGAILSELIKALIVRWSGRYERLNQVWKRVDVESRKRRVLEEELHRVRILARDAGVPSDKLGDWPVFTDSTRE